jgi:hypothetical protein
LASPSPSGRLPGYILNDAMITPRVTFLDGLTGHLGVHHLGAGALLPRPAPPVKPSKNVTLWVIIASLTM